MLTDDGDDDDEIAVWCTVDKEEERKRESVCVSVYVHFCRGLFAAATPYQQRQI